MSNKDNVSSASCLIVDTISLYGMFMSKSEGTDDIK